MPFTSVAHLRGPSRTLHAAGLEEPQVGIEPTTARLRIECSTTELLWRCAMPWSGLEPLCLSAPPPQDGVSTNFTTRATCRRAMHAGVRLSLRTASGADGDRTRDL